MQSVQHLPLLFGQVGYYAVKKKCRLVQQPFGRFDILYDHAAGEDMQSCIFLRRKIFARKDNNPQLISRGRSTELLEKLESSHIRQTQIQNDTVKLLLPNSFECV